jgi:hypothetical protein
MTIIRIGDAISRAVKQVTKNVVQRASGLYVPPDYIAGKHFGGFNNYTPWIQDCIRACCESARGVGPDELSEITGLAFWQPERVEFVVKKHAEVMAILEQLAARIADQTQTGEGLTAKIQEQILKVQGGRERGTLMVIALNPHEAEGSGELKACVSAWNPASIEEARAVPKQVYTLG